MSKEPPRAYTTDIELLLQIYKSYGGSFEINNETQAQILKSKMVNIFDAAYNNCIFLIESWQAGRMYQKDLNDKKSL